MARIAGVDLPREKRIEIGLTYIYGIGRPSADKILAKAEVNPDTRVRDLTDDEVKRLSAVIDETMTVEGDLRREIALNIKRLQEIGCYRGIRHRKGLPVRGQKTKTNARTRKGPKRTVANKNKDKALKVLRSRLYEMELAKQHDAEAEARRSQIGTGDRSEKIRTYNFPQGRVTDHRIKLTLHRLENVLNGDLDEIIDSLIAADQAAKLSNLQDAE